MGDGEQQEGQVWEAAMAAAYHHADRLVAIIDRNKIQNDDFVANQMVSEPLDSLLAKGEAQLKADHDSAVQVAEFIDHFDSSNAET